MSCKLCQKLAFLDIKLLFENVFLEGETFFIARKIKQSLASIIAEDLWHEKPQILCIYCKYELRIKCLTY